MKRPGPPPDESRPAEGELLDLPLGPGGEAPDTGPPPPAAAPPAAATSPPSFAGSVSRRRWRLPLLVAVLLVVGAAVGFLWPRGAPPVARLSETLLDFGEQRAGVPGDPREVVVTNAGRRPLEVTGVSLGGEAATDFEVAADGCTGRRLAAEEPCTVMLRFAPTAAAAERRAVLEVAGPFLNAPVQLPLLGSAVAPLASLDRRQIDFGERPVGRPGGSETVVLRNRGTGPLTLGAAAVEGEGFVQRADFCSRSTLRPGERCTLEIAFEPPRTGEAGGSVTFASDAGGEPLRVALTGTGVPAPVRLRLEPAQLDFGGPVEVGARRIRTLRVLHPEGEGEGPVPVLVVAVEGVEGAGGGFTVSGETCTAAPLPPAGDCSVNVAFAPPRPGPAAAELVLRWGGEGEEQEERLALAGEGVEPPRLGADPQGIDWGEVALGEGRERTVTLENLGGTPLTLRRAAVSGAAAADFRLAGGSCGETPVVLAPGESCELRLRFVPSRPGRRTARLALDHDGRSGPAGLELEGRAPQPAAPAAAVSPRRLDFGALPVGERGEIRTVTLSNPGNARLRLGRIRLAGAAAGDFRIVPGSCDGLPFLAPGGECTMGLRFVPTAAGTRRGRLVFESDAPGGEAAAELEGRGLPPPGR